MRGEGEGGGGRGGGRGRGEGRGEWGLSVIEKIRYACNNSSRKRLAFIYSTAAYIGHLLHTHTKSCACTCTLALYVHVRRCFLEEK